MLNRDRALPCADLELTMMDDEDIFLAFDDLPKLANMLQDRLIVEPRQDSSISVLHQAAAWGKTDVLALLLEKGGRRFINHPFGPFAWTALFMAARSGHIPAVKMLLENGADPNYYDSAGSRMDRLS